MRKYISFFVIPLIVFAIISAVILLAFWVYGKNPNIGIIRHTLFKMRLPVIQALGIIAVYYTSKSIVTTGLKETSDYSFLYYFSCVFTVGLFCFFLNIETFYLFLYYFLLIVFPALLGVRNAISDFNKKQKNK